MRSYTFDILILMLLWAIQGMAGDSIPDLSALPQKPTPRYSLRKFLPSQLIAQNAGNMGWLSAGVGWSYGGAKQWETHFLVGFVPKYKSCSAKPTITLKETFIPWHLQFNPKTTLEPLSCGLYVNTIIGQRFWSHLPSRYPNNYYWFSTRFRVNVFIGEQLVWKLRTRPGSKPMSISAFYELSTCDLYLVDYWGNRSLKVKDLIGLSLGLKLQVF